MADIQTLTLRLIVLAADALFGGLPGLRQALSLPLGAVAALGGWLEARLNRARRSDANRTVRGALVVIVVVIAAWGVGLAIDAAARALPAGWIVQGVALACLLGQRRLIDRVRGVARALAGDDIDDVRARLDELVRYDTATLDGHGVARGGVEAAAARSADGVAGAVFWFLLAGLPALCVYRANAVLAVRVSRPGAAQTAFGLAAARLDGALTLAPGFIAGLLVALASLFVPGAKPGAAFGLWLRDAGERLADGAGRARGAMAGALGGPRPSPDGPVPGAWIGDGRARAVAADVRRATLALVLACLLNAVIVAGLIVVAGL